MSWKDIVAGDIPFASILPKERSRHVIAATCRKSKEYSLGWTPKGEWSDLTLGEICNLGVKEWERNHGWGVQATEMFKEFLRQVAKDPTIITVYPDRFDPEEEGK